MSSHVPASYKKAEMTIFRFAGHIFMCREENAKAEVMSAGCEFVLLRANICDVRKYLLIKYVYIFVYFMLFQQVAKIFGYVW